MGQWRLGTGGITNGWVRWGDGHWWDMVGENQASRVGGGSGGAMGRGGTQSMRTRPIVCEVGWMGRWAQVGQG